MNLATQPWIPVTDLSGAAQRVSLREVFTKGRELADFSVRPHERIALMRLLLCIAHRALQGPKDSAALERAADELPDAAAAYLDDKADCFDLFDPVKPFLQFPGLAKPPKPAGKKAKKADSAEDEEEEGTAASKLDFALATGNNPTLFDNQAATELPRVFEPADLALMLITFQCFSPGGRIGVALWNGKETPGKGSSGHAPCSPSAMLHAFLRGKNVLETITANLVTEATVRQNYGKSFGHPVWEKFPASFQDQD
ncbi:MAG: type I-E CRISPR-associated protein Cse1/CasA, partial [Prosthecobacter sp.]|nr:type I-E CRISPR-associated protein Cse1/CasA [Prosthecobacter sp.]